MSFWEEHAQAEAAHKAAKVKEPGPQNMPSRCETCGAWNTDVLLGICGPCFETWETQRGTALQS